MQCPSYSVSGNASRTTRLWLALAGVQRPFPGTIHLKGRHHGGLPQGDQRHRCVRHLSQSLRLLLPLPSVAARPGVALYFDSSDGDGSFSFVLAEELEDDLEDDCILKQHRWAPSPWISIWSDNLFLWLIHALTSPFSMLQESYLCNLSSISVKCIDSFDCFVRRYELYGRSFSPDLGKATVSRRHSWELVRVLPDDMAYSDGSVREYR